LDFGWATGPFGGGAVLFTPPTTPWVLSKIKVMAWYLLDDAPFFIEIWDSDREELYSVTYMYSDYFTSQSWDWAEIEIPNIVVEGDFYVGVFGNWAETHILLLGVDNDPLVSYRSFAVRYDNNAIDYVEEWNWMIRAVGTHAIAAIIDFDPDTLNLRSKGKWVTAYIEFPDIYSYGYGYGNGYDVQDIDIGTVMLNETIPAERGDVQDGVLMVKFDRSDVQDMLDPGDEVEITVSGELTDGTPFEGSDTIKVIE
jgi:hypothetical protein